MMRRRAWLSYLDPSTVWQTSVDSRTLGLITEDATTALSSVLLEVCSGLLSRCHPHKVERTAHCGSQPIRPETKQACVIA
jgi:hypothetical protein